MLNKELLDKLEKLESEFFNNVFIIKYRGNEYIISRRWEVKVLNGKLSVLVEQNYSEPTPFHVGEVRAMLEEYPDDIEIMFYSKFSSRHFNSHRISDLEFTVRRQ